MSGKDNTTEAHCGRDPSRTAISVGRPQHNTAGPQASHHSGCQDSERMTNYHYHHYYYNLNLVLQEK
ncbi:hypothetical protein Pmani_025708 [Petrolisthes manimaculis]|uniref:Uncharacterized protein n=1 Tax=Petrolisthes manimaculis TaxID=1843537 RepID=A0AAE1TYP6_9EUCA|nr:hypothetical protein Pmani_025708 [Petrolisthes manimaculis]